MTTDNRKVQLGVEVDATAARAGFDQVKAGAKDMAQVVARAGQDGAKGLDGMGAGGDAAAQKLDRATSSMIASVRRATAELQAGGRGTAQFFDLISQQRGVNADALKPYLDQLRQVEAAQLAASGSLGKIGVSAKQTAAALRGVPAQFTDIVTSLQGGQAPLTVLLQQGGQLKDMFGGAGNAARALGGYVLGLVNPFTVTAAAVGVLGFAYMQGAKESQEFAKALILSGNAAGTTVGQLQSMASAVSAATGATKGAAADALTAFAANGSIAAAQLEKFSAVAIKIERETGTAVSKTVAQFAELGREPVAASVKLNESTQYLTLSLYKQIKALQDQGQSAQAAVLAQTAYADAMDARTGKLNENLGSLERGWRAITSGAKSAWDAMLGIGRPETALSALKDAQDELQQRLQRGALNANTQTAFEKGNQALKDRIGNLRETASLEARAATAEAERAVTVQQRIKWDAQGVEFLTKQERLTRELAKAQGEAQSLLAKGEITREEAATRMAAIRAKFAEKAPASDANNAYARIAADIQRADDAAQQYLDTGEELAASDKFRLDTLKQLEALRAEGKTSLQGLVDLESQMNDAQLKLLEVERERHQLRQETANFADNARAFDVVEKEAAALQKQVQAQREHNAQIGLSKDAIAELEAAKLSEMATSKERAADLADAAEIDRATGDLYREQAKALRELAKLKAEGGAKAVAVDAAKKAADEWKRTADKIENSITDALMRGFENGKGFAENLRDVVLNMFKTMVLRPVVSAVVSPVAQGLTNLIGGGAGAGAGGGAGGATGATLNGLSTGSNLATLGGAASQFWGGYSAGASSASLMYANSVGALGGDALGALYSANGGWAGVSAGSSAAGGSAAAGGGAAAGGAAVDYAAFAGYATSAISFYDAAIAADKGRWGEAIGRAAGTYFFGYLGGEVGGALGGAIDKAFGGGQEYTVGTGLQGTFSREGFAGRNYQNWQNDGSSGFFGFGGAKASSGTNYSALDGGTSRGLGQVFNTLQAQTAGFAQMLGLSGDAIFGFTKSIEVAFTQDAAANKAAVEGALTTIASDLARTVLDGQYLREGEAAANTLARLATSLNLVNNAFGTLDKAALSVSQAGGNSASQLVELLGGVEKFTSTTLSYYQQYYTDAERNAKSTEQLFTAFAALGVAVPDSLEAYRELVNAQDIGTESGRNLYASLMGLSGAFAAINASAAAASATLLKSFRFATYVDYAAANARAGVTPAPRFAAGGMHAGGLRMVGENGPELEATGPARIWNDSQLRSALQGQGADAAVAEMRALRDDNRAQARSMAALYTRMVKVLDGWELNGMPEVRAV